MELHPRFAARDEAMRADAHARGWRVGHVRTVATYAQQQALYAKYLNGTGNQAANPDSIGYPSPWGWLQLGSWHMEQVDGYGHAIDYSWDGCTPADFHALCAEHGIGFPVVSENWHAQWFDWRGIFINHHGDDMNKEEFAAAIGAQIAPDGPFAGQVCVHLVGDNLNDLDGSGQLWPLADAIKFTHQELKLVRLKG